MSLDLLDVLAVLAALGQVYNLWRVAHLQIPAISMFITYALFTVAEVWMALDGMPSMWFWALISVYSLLMSTKAIHEKYFKERFDVV